MAVAGHLDGICIVHGEVVGVIYRVAVGEIDGVVGGQRLANFDGGLGTNGNAGIRRIFL